MIPIQYAWILLFAIALTNAVPLNGICENNAQCTETGVVCTAGKCQCNTPFYKPCNTSCEVVPQFAYVGEDCAVTKNCVENAECANNKCKCNSGYTLKNGACFKNLTANCQNHSECWSKYCLQSICACPPGYKSTDGVTTCQSALVNVYNTWAEANAANAFCEDDNSCFDIIAKCVNDTAHPQSKFCKCPSGYNIQDINNRRQCSASVSQNLSPLDFKPLNGYGECGKCADENAVCINVAGQTTCWCRAGYVKRENKCVSRGKSEIIFPNSKDLQMHNFTAGCSPDSNAPDKIKNQLCVCARGYKFVPQNRTCEKIVPKWQNEVYEYGLCTHINSKDEADADNGECPEPLKCLPLNDKHVCSCGKDKFQDLDNSTQCVYFIDKGANATDRRCPQNTLTGTTDNCACADGYKVTPDNKQCELKLSPNTADTSCNANLTTLVLCRNFGVNAVLCAIGECRCSEGDSLPNKDLTRCYAKLSTPLPPQKEECPPNSNLNNNICTCADSYRPSADLRECVSVKVPLTEYQGPTVSPNGGLTTADCKVWYSGSVEAYDNDNCQCTSIAIKADDISGCRYKPNVALPADRDINFCSLNSDYIGGLCVCKSGYKEANNLCTPIVDQVYPYGDLTGVNINGINDTICVNLFGTASIKSPNGDYCICKNISYPAPNKKICKFLINITSEELKYPDVCPDNSIVFPLAKPSACICEPGYSAFSNNQLCVRANIALVGTAKMDNTNNCNNFNNSDCIALYGEQAFCKNEACYCNRDLSFIANQKCESFTNYKFPGEHELYLYACQENGDCAGKGNVTCDYVDSSSKYKVCRCQDGSYLNPTTETCEDNRCTNCDVNLNFECRDYVCQCKSGYIRNGAGCVKSTTELQLYQPCNRDIFRDIPDDQALVCDANCNYARCKDGYRIDKMKCVQLKLASDKCLQDETICKLIDQNANCSRDANQCLCGPSYYKWENKCARAVGFDCTNDGQCGIGTCKAKRCDCKGGQRVENMNDSNGRPIQGCRNGIDQIRSNPVLLFLLLLVLARVVIN